MKTSLPALFVGFLFAAGLGLSGMTHPDKIIGFLNVFGQWDPTLCFVIGGAVTTYGVLFIIIKRRSTPVFADRFQVPTNRQLDAKLFLGSAVFGIGWGMGGFCPGPAITVIPDVAPEIIIFVATMIAGMAVHMVTVRPWKKRVPSREDA